MCGTSALRTWCHCHFKRNNTTFWAMDRYVSDGCARLYRLSGSLGHYLRSLRLVLNTALLPFIVYWHSLGGYIVFHMSHPELVLLHRFASSATTTMALYGLKIQPPQQLRRLKRHASSTLAKTRDSSRDPTATESKGMIEDPDIASYWLLFFCIRIPRISKSTKQK